MRFMALLLLLPALAWAQSPAQQMDPQQFFEQTKKMMLPMMQETLPAMREARTCLQAAGDQAAFEQCAQILTDLDEKMRARMGAVHGANGQQQPMRDPKEIEWNEQTKKNMLQFLDHSIATGDVMSGCLNQSTTVEQMQQCMQSKRPQP